MYLPLPTRAPWYWLEPYVPAPALRLPAPAVTVRRDNDGLVVTCEVASLDPSALEVQVSGPNLWIRGGLDVRHRSPEVYAALSTAFVRSVPLPDDVDPSRIERTVQAGRLILRVPRRGRSWWRDLRERLVRLWRRP
jgi:HSP20 family molecular chaperone IbpA